MMIPLMFRESISAKLRKKNSRRQISLPRLESINHLDLWKSTLKRKKLKPQKRSFSPSIASISSSRARKRNQRRHNIITR